MHHRRTHHKSRQGCLACKKRKIKCDEGRPSCANCVNFQIPCSFDHRVPARDSASAASAANEDPPATVKRQRGRPRKDWSILAHAHGPGTKTRIYNSTVPLNQQSSDLQALPNPAHPGPSSLNVDDLELFLHFISHTGPGLAHPRPPNSPDAQFWSQNAPQIGLSCHTVLHLMLGLAAHHLVFLTENDTERSARYLALATHHSSAGLSKLTQALQYIDDSNCGALYVSAILVADCTFAAGPTARDDLLVCNISNHDSQSWKSVVQGVRLIREAFEPSVLFSGPMGPLGPSEDEQRPPVQPGFIEYGFPRIDWEGPLGRLRESIVSSNDTDLSVCLEAYYTVESIYEATFGKSDGSMACSGKSKFVFLWLYVMDHEFVRCLQQKHPLSFLVLAYYAVLLKTQQHAWFMQRWPIHMLSRIQTLIDQDYVEELRWPLEQAGLPLVERSSGSPRALVN